MLKRLLLLAAFLVSTSAASAAEPVRRLMMVGGGEWPAEAAARFVQWAGGPENAHILLIPWATTVPDEYFATAQEYFTGVRLEMAVASDTLKDGGLAAQLERATAIWFLGGDQVRHMAALNSNGGAPLRAVRKRWEAGIPFGGTSAGTALMSKIMITGEGDFSVIDGDRVQTSEGLGLIDGVITDQHFIRRSRENRLFGVVLKHRDHVGLGIDENTVFAMEGDRGEVIGPGLVMVVRAAPAGPEDLTLELLRAGQVYDLKSRKRVTQDAP